MVIYMYLYLVLGPLSRECGLVSVLYSRIRICSIDEQRNIQSGIFLPITNRQLMSHRIIERLGDFFNNAQRVTRPVGSVLHVNKQRHCVFE